MGTGNNIKKLHHELENKNLSWLQQNFNNIIVQYNLSCGFKLDKPLQPLWNQAKC